MKLVTAEQMRAIDAETINNRGISGPELMENAGRGIAEKIRENILGDPKESRIAVLCGKGNNGGDGFVVGRYLFEYGCDVTIYLPAPCNNLSPDAFLNFNRAKELGVKLIAVEACEQLPDDLEVDYIIDAIFGTGFSGSPRGLLSKFVQYINNKNVPVIAVDCPSGLDVDNGACEGDAVQAMFSYPLAASKIGMYYSPGREKCGMIDIVPIGIPDDVWTKFDINENLITSEMVGKLLPKRKPDGHKGDFGKLFILAGSTGLTGAATLVAEASVRSGLGLVTVGCPQTINPILENKLTEPMTYPLPDVGKKGFLAKRGLGGIRKKIAENDVVIIGPGIGTHFETRELIQKIISEIDKPTVIDADGLNAFAKNREGLLGKHPKFVLTPHPGEFKRLIDEEIPEDLSDKYNLVRKYAKKFNSVIVLKGSPTIIVDTDEQLYLNPTGNNGMATGGSGDVLSGIIGSFLAQGLCPLDSAIVGVYVHGLCGDLAADDYSERAMIAGDLIDYLPDAFILLETSAK